MKWVVLNPRHPHISIVSKNSAAASVFLTLFFAKSCQKALAGEEFNKLLIKGCPIKIFQALQLLEHVLALKWRCVTHFSKIIA